MKTPTRAGKRATKSCEGQNVHNMKLLYFNIFVIWMLFKNKLNKSIVKME